MPVLLSPFSLWRQWRNQIDFTLNQLVQWKRGGYQEKAEDKQAFFTEFDFLKPTELALLERYPHLQNVKQRASLIRYLMNLNRALVCEQLLALSGMPVSTEPLSMLEVGIKNGDMLDGLWATCRERLVNNDEQLQLTGIECDMWRISEGFYSRWDKAQHFSQMTPNTTVIAGDAGQHQGQYDYIWFFLPFVFPETADAWGLPRSLYNPTALFEHLVSQCLKDGGYLLVTHQTDEEVEAMQALMAQSSLLNTQLTHLGAQELSQPFVTHYPQYVHQGQVWQKRSS